MQKQVVYIEIEPSDPNTMLKDAIEATSTSAGLTFMMNTKVEIVDQLLSDPSVYDHTLFLIRGDTTENGGGKANSLKDLVAAVSLRCSQVRILVQSSGMHDNSHNLPKGVTVIQEGDSDTLMQSLHEFGQTQLRA